MDKKRADEILRKSKNVIAKHYYVEMLNKQKNMAISLKKKKEGK